MQIEHSQMSKTSLGIPQCHPCQLIRQEGRGQQAHVQSTISSDIPENNSNSSPEPDCSKPRLLPLLNVLRILVFKRCSPLFILANRPSVKKLLLTLLVSRLSTFYKKTAFRSIMEAPCVQEVKNLRESLQNLKDFSQQSKREPIIKDGQMIQKLYVSLEELRSSIWGAHSQNKGFPSQRRGYEFEIENKKLKIQNQYLRGCLQQSVRREERANRKKEQSLKMLAEGLQEKDQIIEDLKYSLAYYEEKFATTGNVLESSGDYNSLKWEIQNMHGIRDKLEREVKKARERYADECDKTKQLCRKIKCLSAQKSDWQNQLHDNQLARKVCQAQKSQAEKLSVSFKRKFKRLAAYEKQIQNKWGISRGHSKDEGASLILGNISKEGQERESFHVAPNSLNFMDEAKTEVVLGFLAGIQQSGSEVIGSSLLSCQELSVLLAHAQKFKSLKGEKQAAQNDRIYPLRCEAAKNYRTDPIQCQNCAVDPNQVLMRGGTSSSVFSALDSGSGEDNFWQQGRKDKNFSLRLLEFELEKNKQIQKISELKEKMMHIRVIVLNLMKSLELTQLKAETQGVLDVIFDMFQYSEEERDSMLFKKRKRFGLF